MTTSLLVSFPDQSHSFTHGVEYGRILGMMEAAQSVVDNKGFPVHTQNVEALRELCASFGYTPNFSPVEGMDEWTNFFALKTGERNN